MTSTLEAGVHGRSGRAGRPLWRPANGAVTAAAAPSLPAAGGRPDAGFHELAVTAVTPQTADSVTVAFAVPRSLGERFRYRAGQFVTVRVEVGGREHLRCYSMSSSPDVDEDMAITVKRVPGGPVSNWFNDSVRPGDQIALSPPAGAFTLGGARHDEVVALAAGSGITPVFSLLKTALVTTTCRVRLFYANRDRASVIFGAALSSLAARHPGRLAVVHHLDSDVGPLGRREVEAFVAAAGPAELYVCGPGGFMDTVESVLDRSTVPSGRAHVERFALADSSPAVTWEGEGRPPEVVFELAGRSARTEHRSGASLLQTARSAGLRPPSSCEIGSCATCMARVVEGSASMRQNTALTPGEVEEGWVLTCQAVPTSPTLRVVF